MSARRSSRTTAARQTQNPPAIANRMKSSQSRTGMPSAGTGESRAEASRNKPSPSGRRAPAGPGGGWREVRMDPAARLVTLPSGVGVDLGGIAKGMAVDAAVERLSAAGLGPVMVNAGGDLRVQGRPPGGGDWWIEIDGPRGRLRVRGAARGRGRAGAQRGFRAGPARCRRGGECRAADPWP